MNIFWFTYNVGLWRWLNSGSRSGRLTVTGPWFSIGKRSLNPNWRIMQRRGNTGFRILGCIARTQHQGLSVPRWDSTMDCTMHSPIYLFSSSPHSLADSQTDDEGLINDLASRAFSIGHEIVEVMLEQHKPTSGRH